MTRKIIQNDGYVGIRKRNPSVPLRLTIVEAYDGYIIMQERKRNKSDKVGVMRYLLTICYECDKFNLDIFRKDIDEDTISFTDCPQCQEAKSRVTFVIRIKEETDNG